MAERKVWVVEMWVAERKVWVAQLGAKAAQLWKAVAINCAARGDAKWSGSGIGRFDGSGGKA